MKDDEFDAHWRAIEWCQDRPWLLDILKLLLFAAALFLVAILF